MNPSSMDPAVVVSAEDAFAAATVAIEAAEEAIALLGCQFDDPLVVEVRDTHRRIQRHRALLDHRYKQAVAERAASRDGV